ncbi:MAG: glycosyltransferase [Desulfuromonas sp.]|nr:glycosyltransferase [Desulfuromonas sp.]
MAECEQSPTIDIVLASCNGATYIRAQIQSMQECARYAELVRKLIVVDDASEDSTLQILHELAQADARMVVIANSGARRGVMQNFAFGLLQTVAPYIVLSDQDDVWNSAKLDELFCALRQAESVHGETTPVLGFSDLAVVDAELNLLDTSFWHHQALKPEWAQHLRQLLCQNIAPGCSMILNRPLLHKALPFPSAAAMHDWWLLLTAKAFGQVFYIEEALLLYRQHGSNQVGAPRFRNLCHLGVKGIVHRARTNLSAISAQARVFYATFGIDNLSSADIPTLLALKDLPSKSLRTRLWLVLNGTIRKNSSLRNLALFVLMFFPPLPDGPCDD